MMVFGLILIVAGLLIAVFPQLLSMIVAFTLILAGLLLTYIGHYFKKASRRFNDPFIDFFFRL